METFHQHFEVVEGETLQSAKDRDGDIINKQHQVLYSVIPTAATTSSQC